MIELGPVLVVVVAVGVARLVTRRTGIPSPALLVVAGLVVGAVHSSWSVELKPDLVLVLVLPPLLYGAALESSLLDLRANRRPIALLSVGLVIFTAVVVGAVALALIPGLPAPAAFAFGAIVAPPDAVAAIAIGRRVGMPARLQTIVEGEGLLNDATSLVLYRVMVAAAIGGGFSFLETGGRIVYSAVGGGIIGFVVAKITSWVRSHLEEPLVENGLSLATPFLAYLPAEEIGASGVVAVVIAGVLLGHASPTVQSSVSRLQTQPVWRLVVFLLEGAVFLLIGLQLPEILDGLDAYSRGELATYAVVLLLVVLVSRPLWIFTTMYLPRRLRARYRDDLESHWELPTALSWAGMRGVVSLAAAFALPLTGAGGRPFPQRDLLLFLTFVVICATLLLQGLTFARVLRLLGLRRDQQSHLLSQANAQQSAVQAGLRRLDELTDEQAPADGVVEALREVARHRMNAGWERLSEVRNVAARDGSMDETPSAGWRRLRGAMLVAERTELIRLRDSGQLSEEALRELQRQLDFEEVGLQR